MVGFAVASYREKTAGESLISQGLGTSMLQVPNISEHPLILIPPTLTSMILGPLATTVLVMENIPAGAGMGTSGLVSQFEAIEAMGVTTDVFIKMGLLHFVLPIIIHFFNYFSIYAEKGWIKFGDMRLDILNYRFGGTNTLIFFAEILFLQVKRGPFSPSTLKITSSGPSIKTFFSF